MNEKEKIAELAAKSGKAQDAFESFDQKQADLVVRTPGKAVMAPEESYAGMVDIFFGQGTLYAEDPVPADKFRAVLFSTGGSVFNGFVPAATLVCGSRGNNSISENLDYHHLINISRIGLYNDKGVLPSEQELSA